MRRLADALRRRMRAGPARAAREEYARQLARVRKEAAARGLEVIEAPHFDAGAHPEGYADFECRFAAFHLQRANPSTVLDVGSYRHFVVGISAGYAVTSLDVRPRSHALATETVLTGDARAIPAADAAFDAVVSLSSIEHFGLGRYGDPLDLDGDRLAAAEMARVLRPGGLLVLTTTLTRARPAIAFNAHRLYDLASARALAPGLEPVDERFFSHRAGGECRLDAITADPGGWDVYCGAWRKPGAPASSR